MACAGALIRPSPSEYTLPDEGYRLFKKKWYPPKRPANYHPRFADYEREKQNWIAHHPKASGQEYVEAMRELAIRCGI